MVGHVCTESASGGEDTPDAADPASRPGDAVRPPLTEIRGLPLPPQAVHTSGLTLGCHSAMQL